MVSHAFSILLLVLGFSFVVFFHELGHFLAAKWSGICVEQFALGFGQAIFSWRKGMGFTLGSSGTRYEQLKEEGNADGVGETEYRFNWIPLGGYVKMLGQDDLRPGAEAEDPRAYNKQPVGRRMVVVSAGVIMNVILAGIGFMTLFLHGFNVPKAVTGLVLPLSPAQQAGVQPGDELVRYNGETLYDFNKLAINVRCSAADESADLVVRPPGGGPARTLHLTPTSQQGGILAIGITPPPELRGLEVPETTDKELFGPKLMSQDHLALGWDESIVKIGDEPVPDVTDYYLLDQALQKSNGQPIQLTVRNAAGQTRTIQVQPHFTPPFDILPISFAGMVPRTRIDEVLPDSPARGKILPNDVIASISIGSDTIPHPSRTELIQDLNQAGHNGQTVKVQVLRDGVLIKPIELGLIKVDKESSRYGLGVMLEPDESHPLVAQVLADSPAAKAGIPAGATLGAINGQLVKNWYDVKRILESAPAGKPIEIIADTDGGSIERTLTLTPQQIQSVTDLTYSTDLLLRQWNFDRKTGNVLTAAHWGMLETRDSILQVYLTLRRLFERSIPASQVMGPLGMFVLGKAVAYKGNDWLLWFLSLISANLAVVNFLPIPVMDGGLFVFLILEKIKGKPASPRTQQVAQIIGLVVIFSMVLFVTYHDILQRL